MKILISANIAEALQELEQLDFTAEIPSFAEKTLKVSEPVYFFFPPESLQGNARTDNVHLTNFLYIERVLFSQMIIRKKGLSMSMAEKLRNYLEDISDLAEEEKSTFRTAAAMVNFEWLTERFSETPSDELFPLIRKTLLAAVKWSKAFSETTGTISENELLKRGLGRGLFALHCTGIGNFSRVEWQIRSGISNYMKTKENNGKKPKIHRKTVSRKPEKCPFCNSGEIKKIIYGMPAPDFDYSKYISGGCCVTPDSPTWGCGNCSAGFRKKTAQKEKSI